MEKELDVEYLRNILSFTNFHIVERAHGFHIFNIISKKPEESVPVQFDITINEASEQIKCKVAYVDKTTNNWKRGRAIHATGKVEFAKQLIYFLLWIN